MCVFNLIRVWRRRHRLQHQDDLGSAHLHNLIPDPLRDTWVRIRSALKG